MSGFGLHHYAVAVRDLDEAAQTYRRLLGLEVGERGRDEGASLPWGPPPAPARRSAERTGRAAGDLELQGGAVRFDPRWTHGLPMILATLPAAGPRPVWPSHVAVAVADLAAAEATFAGGFGLVAERRFEADYGDFAASALYRGGREVLALMTGRSETSAVSRRMRGMITPENPRGEGFYLASWSARDPSGLSERVERAGGLVARQHHSFFIHPRSTHGVHMRIYPAEA